ncbi:hypothetical protein CF326_g1482 [Tilletia indica]|nr:hypothetical protein CF326_g1482 [Tilletia indica]
MDPGAATRMSQQQQQQRPQRSSPNMGVVTDGSKPNKLDTVLYAFYQKMVAVVSNLRLAQGDRASNFGPILSPNPNDGSNSPTSQQPRRSPSISSASQQATGTSSTSASTTGIPYPPSLAAKWFSLELDVPPSLRRPLEAWKSVSSHIPELLLRSSTPPSPTSARTSFASVVPDPATCVSPLIIDVILDTSALDPAKHALMLAGHDGRHYRVDDSENPAYPAAGSKPAPRQKQILLESWKLTFIPFSPPTAPNARVFYQHCVPHIRTLYNLANNLPANRLCSRLSELRAQHESQLQHHDESDPAHVLSDSPAPVSLDSLLDIVCRISAGHEQQQQFAHTAQEIGVHQPLGTGQGAQVPAFSAGRGDTRTSEAERPPVTSSRVFEPLLCEIGALHMQVTYRNQVDFSVDDSESLRNLLEMDVDEDYFRPTVAAHRPKSQIGNVNIPSTSGNGQAQSPAVSPAKERPPSALQHSNAAPSRRSFGESQSNTSRPSSATQRMPTLPPLPSFTSGRAAQTPSSTTSSPVFSNMAEAALYYAQIAQGQTGQVPMPSQTSPSPSALSRSPSVFNPVPQSVKPVAGLSSLRRASSLNPSPQPANMWPGASGFNVGTGAGAGAGTGTGTGTGNGVPTGLGSFRSSSNVGLASLQAGSSGTGSGVGTPLGIQPYTPSSDMAGPSSPSFSAALAAGEHAAFRIQHSRRPSISERDRRLRSVGSFNSEVQNYYGLGTDSPSGYGTGTPGTGGGQYGYPFAYAGSLGSAGGAAMLAAGAGGFSVGSTSGSGLQRQPLVRASISNIPGSLPIRGGTPYSPSSPLPVGSQTGMPTHPYGLPITSQQNALGVGPSSLGGSGVDQNLAARRSLSLLTAGRRPPLPLSYSSSTGASLTPSIYMMSTGNVRSIFEKYAPSASTRAGQSPAGTPTSPLLRRQSQLSGGAVPGVVVGAAGLGNGGSPRASTATTTMGALERRSIAIAASKRSEEAVEKGGGSGSGVGAGGSPAGATGPASGEVSPVNRDRDEDVVKAGAASPIFFDEGGVARRSSGGSIARVGSAPSWSAAGERLRRKSSAISSLGGARPGLSIDSSPKDDDLGAFVRMLDARPALSTSKDPRLELMKKAISPSGSDELRKEAVPEERVVEKSPPPSGSSLSFSSRMHHVGSSPLSGGLSATTGLPSTRQSTAPMNRAQIDDMLQRMVLAVKDEFPSSTDNSLFIRSGPSRLHTRSSFGGLLSRQASMLGPGSVPGSGSLTAPPGAMGAAMDSNRSGSGSGSGNGSGFSLRGGHARAGSNIGHAAFPPASRGTGAYTATSLDKLPPPDKHNDDPGEDEAAGRLELAEGEGWAESADRRGQDTMRVQTTQRQNTSTTAALPAALPRDHQARMRWRAAAGGGISPSRAGSIGANPDLTPRSYTSGPGQAEAPRREETVVQPATYAGLTRFGMGRGAFWGGGMRNIDAMGAGGGMDATSAPSNAGGPGHDVNLTFPRMRGDGPARHFGSRSPAEEVPHSYAHAYGPPYAPRSIGGGGASNPSTSPSAGGLDVPGDAGNDIGAGMRTYGGFGSGLPPPGPVYGFAPSTPSPSQNSFAARRRGLGGGAMSANPSIVGPSLGTSPVPGAGPGSA